MSTMNPLPPQAYTKDTLVQAYAWLQSQSDPIKEMATTPDVLVSLYLKAKLQGNGALERPSIQNFKNELKNLAGMMGEFEVVEEAPPATIRFRSQNLKSHSEKTSASQEAPSIAETHSEDSTSSVARLDLRSLQMIQEVKTQFNLSSDTEAMRLLLSVGYNQVKNLLK